MKHLKVFNDIGERDEYMNSTPLPSYPYVHYIKSIQTPIYSGPENDIPLYIDAIEGGTIQFSNTYQYSSDAVAWESATSSTTLSIKAGERLYVRASGLTASTSSGIGTFAVTGKFNIGGNVMSMIYGHDYRGKAEIQQQYNFYMLFGGCKNLISAKHLALPATTLADHCYRYMFNGCTSLVTAPVLPATTLAAYCCYAMFNDCTSLVTAPELPATTLADSCYRRMFEGCTSLVTAPELPATTLAGNCYFQMFNGCTSLVAAPELPATTLADSCYVRMFEGTNLLPDCSNIDFSSIVVAASGGLKSLFAKTKVTDSDLERILPKNSNGKYCLPLIALSERCYEGMFSDCTSLVTAPELPATTLAVNCYSSMFNGCTSLVTAPELPATTLADSCYSSMFSGCTSLVTAPVLSATTLVTYCYWNMFKNCSKLNYIKAMFTTTPSNTYTYNWVYGVASKGEFVKSNAANWDVRGVNGVPSGWTSISVAPSI